MVLPMALLQEKFKEDTSQSPEARISRGIPERPSNYNIGSQQDNV